MDRMSFEAVIGKARERIPTDRIGHWYWRGLSKVGDSGNVKVTFRRTPSDGIVDTKTVVVENVTLAETGDYADEQDTPLFDEEPPDLAANYAEGYAREED